MIRALASCALISLLCSACTVQRAYLVDPPVAACLQAQQCGSEPVAAVREKDGHAVRVRPEAFARADVSAPVGPHARAIARGKSKMVLAGNLLVWIGTPISILGTALFLAQPSGDLHTAGLIMAPSAEPLMITGTILWVVGLIRPPYELP